MGSLRFIISFWKDWNCDKENYTKFGVVAYFAFTAFTKLIFSIMWMPFIVLEIIIMLPIWAFYNLSHKTKCSYDDLFTKLAKKI